ncbi:hypothetical protein E2C01_050230 [Portunus trituberculatus]|uniref:Uncharacterized protein n=1 Tax=Portunus trituberculatus TaxID=210409 RepID=A0A5B7GG56_PORTR|nr:hypothetical protein [Portunus trituberculatus]
MAQLFYALVSIAPDLPRPPLHVEGKENSGSWDEKRASLILCFVSCEFLRRVALPSLLLFIRETGQYRRRLLPTHNSLQLTLAWKIVWKSTMQYGKSDMEFSQERMKADSIIHPTNMSTKLPVLVFSFRDAVFLT